MRAISYLDVFGVVPEEHPAEEIHAGDLVQTGPNAHPRYTVIAIHGDTAWLRDQQSRRDALMPVRRCRKVQPAC